MNPAITAIQLIVDALAQGALYAALALAIVLVNQATGLVNFAQGAMAMLGSYLGYWFGGMLIPGIGQTAGVIIGVVIALALSALIGAGVERFLMRRFERAEEDTKVVATIGLLTLIGGLAALIWGTFPLEYPFLYTRQDNIQFGPVSISVASFVTFVVIIALMVLLQLLFRGTKLGLGLRAVSDNPGSAALSGIRVGNMRAIGWSLAAVLGTAAAILLAVKSGLTPSNFDGILVYALAAVVIGGLDSPVGAVVAAIGLSVIETLSAAYVPGVGHDLKVVVPFVILFIVLVIRPQGLFGRKAVVRV